MLITRWRQHFESAPMILEYKYSVDALVEEVEKEKNDTDIGLVVASIDRMVDRRPFFAFLPPSAAA